QFMHTTALGQTYRVDTLAPLTIGVQARSWKLEQCAESGYGLTFGELLNQRVRSIPSAIKSAVAFFKMAFSRSRRS
ncbi:hypothetical protein, partial [Pandoraea apista]|uniref:hypothetical protein n=1 Tax=Pandoraea apista TaxID=93218 RepID=UPI001C8BECB0